MLIGVFGKGFAYYLEVERVGIQLNMKGATELLAGLQVGAP